MSQDKSAVGLSSARRVLEEARTALERYQDVTVDDDGSLTFQHSGVPCAVQAA